MSVSAPLRFGAIGAHGMKVIFVAFSSGSVGQPSFPLSSSIFGR